MIDKDGDDFQRKGRRGAFDNDLRTGKPRNAKPHGTHTLAKYEKDYAKTADKMIEQLKTTVGA